MPKMKKRLNRMTIRGFKSIEALEDFELGDLNILIGANGSGKSNVVEFFRLLRAMIEQRLQAYVNEYGPADSYFYNGVKQTEKIEAELFFGDNSYRIALKPTAEGGLIIGKEEAAYWGDPSRHAEPYTELISEGTAESQLKKRQDEPGRTAARGPIWYVCQAVAGWHIYHFHDTSMTAGMRRDSGVEQMERLHPRGENLAAFLLGLREEHTEVYQTIRKTVQRIAPFFDDFKLTVRKGRDEDQVRLTWKQKGKDYIFSPGHLSDGTLRFICLTTALLQPDPPVTLVVDEPELGLHPEALSVLAGLFRSAAGRMQIIAATQSPILLSEFEAEQVVTVDQLEGATRLERLDRASLDRWLNEFSLGELWLKGTVCGGVNDA